MLRHVEGQVRRRRMNGARSHDAAPLAASSPRIEGRRLGICVALGIPVVLLAAAPQARIPGWQWVCLLLALPVLTWGAAPAYRRAWSGLRTGQAGLDLLVSAGALLSLGIAVDELVSSTGSATSLGWGVGMVLVLLAANGARRLAAAHAGALAAGIPG